MFKSRVFSGIQPTGNLHLGNYLGAIVKFVELQNKHECLFCVVDLHAITVWQDPEILRKNIRNIAAAFIASGIDPQKQIIFNQSQVAQHSELAWIFNCVARMGWLNRMTQFKEKAGKNRENAAVGLFAYPVLMAADILAYKATHVPVGDDQKQHLELTRDIAQKFNNDFASSINAIGYNDNFFPLPEPLIYGNATRVMSLRDGTKKMSKSDNSDLSRINLTDNADIIVKKIRKAKTDPYPLPYDKGELASRVEAENLINIFAAIENKTIEEVLKEYGGKEFSYFKNELSQIMVEKVAPINVEMTKLLQNPDYIDRILVDGAARARSIAEPILSEVKQIVGFIA